MKPQLNFLTELDKKEEALDSFEYTDSSWLKEARKQARHFCYANKGYPKYNLPNCITSDDARELMNIKNSGIKYSNNVMGAVFRDGRFKRVGYYQSKANGSHGNIIAIWQLKGKADA